MEPHGTGVHAHFKGSAWRGIATVALLLFTVQAAGQTDMDLLGPEPMDLNGSAPEVEPAPGDDLAQPTPPAAPEDDAAEKRPRAAAIEPVQDDAGDSAGAVGGERRRGPARGEGTVSESDLAPPTSPALPDGDVGEAEKEAGRSTIEPMEPDLAEDAEVPDEEKPPRESRPSEETAPQDKPSSAEPHKGKRVAAFWFIMPETS